MKYEYYQEMMNKLAKYVARQKNGSLYANTVPVWDNDQTILF